MSDEDWMHNDQNREAYECHPNTSKSLPEEGDIQKHQTTDVTLNKLIACFAVLNHHGHFSNMEKEGEDTS